MRQIITGLLGGILLLTACGQTVSVTPMPPILASETNIVSKTALLRCHRKHRASHVMSQPERQLYRLSRRLLLTHQWL